jgi:superfamily II DNA or RNA helicase
MPLFDDQVVFVDDIQEELARLRKILACAATGFGKSKVFIHIALAAQAKGKTVLILTESEKIFNQIQAEIPAQLINPKNKHIFLNANGIYIAMAQTLGRRKELMDQLKMMGKTLLTICDEAHVGHFTGILKHIDDCWLIGFTATPDARWAKHLPELYKGIVVGPQPHELVIKGRLSPYKHFARVGADLDKLELQNGEFTEASQEMVFGSAKVFDGLIDDLTKLPYRKALIFCPSVKDCDKVAAMLNGVGIQAVSIHRTMSDQEFAYRVGMFEKMDINVAVSVGTMTKGYDFPPIDLIVLRRATTSRPLYFQMTGRGSRVIDGEWFLPLSQRTKKGFTVLDYGANYLRHGLWDAEVDWKNLWNKPKAAKEGVAPVKTCPNCEYIVPASASVCPNCEYAFTKKDIPLEVGRLIEITEIYSTRMVGKRIGSLNAEELAIYARLKNKSSFAARIARAHEKEKPGFIEQFAKEMGYKPGWAGFQKELSNKEKEISFTNFVLS